MHGKATEKIPGGKLVRVEAEFQKTVTSARITGDFFLHPEDGLQFLEKVLVSVPVPVDISSVTYRLEAEVKKHNLNPVGLTMDAIARCLKAATEGMHA